MKRAALVNYSSVDISDFVLKLRKKGFDCEVYDKFTLDFINQDYLNTLSCIVFYASDGVVTKKQLQIFDKVSKYLPAVIVNAEIGEENLLVEFTRQYLTEHNCKKWNLIDEVENIVSFLKERLPNETPVCNISEYYGAAVATAIVKEALGERIYRLVYYNDGTNDEILVTNYLNECEKFFGVKPEVIDLRDIYRQMPKTYKDPTERESYVKYYANSHIGALHDLYDLTIYGNGLVCGSGTDFDGKRCDRKIIFKYSAVNNAAFLPLCQPCAYLHKEEIDEVARLLGMSESFINAYNALRCIDE